MPYVHKQILPAHKRCLSSSPEEQGLDSECYEWCLGGQLNLTTETLKQYVGGQVEIFDLTFTRGKGYKLTHYCGEIESFSSDKHEGMNVWFKWVAEKRNGKWCVADILSFPLGPEACAESICGGRTRFEYEWMDFRQSKTHILGVLCPKNDIKVNRSEVIGLE
ncbi:MAG: hypothetical protein WAX66_03635 [Patescibacteria group bacterium]